MPAIRRTHRPPTLSRTRARASPVPPIIGDAGRGRQVYERYCIQCHGAAVTAQRGRALVAAEAADFRQGVYKFSSTRYGSLPTTATRPGDPDGCTVPACLPSPH